MPQSSCRHFQLFLRTPPTSPPLSHLSYHLLQFSFPALQIAHYTYLLFLRSYTQLLLCWSPCSRLRAQSYNKTNMLVCNLDLFNEKNQWTNLQFHILWLDIRALVWPEEVCWKPPPLLTKSACGELAIPPISPWPLGAGGTHLGEV